MKIRLLAVGLMSLFAVNAQASDLRDMIVKNPIIFAAGYALGTIGYKLCTTNIKRALTFKIHEGSQAPFFVECDDSVGSHTLMVQDNSYVQGCDCLGISFFESKFDHKMSVLQSGYHNAVIAETIQLVDIQLLSKVNEFNAQYLPKENFSKTWVIDEATNHKKHVVVDHKAIFAGLATSAMFGGLALLAAKK